MLVAALRRYLSLLGVVCAVTLIGSLLLAVGSGAPIRRAVSLGFYIVGAFLLLIGFFVGNRGPTHVRTDPEGGSGFPVLRPLRWATTQEREEAISTSVIFITLALSLLVLAIIVDERHQLV